MNETGLGPEISRIVTVLAWALVMALGGLILIGILGGDASVRLTLTHIIETLVGVFIGLAAARMGTRM